MTSAGAGPPTVVLGVGNPLMGDDGLGLAALERLRAEFVFDPPVEFVDGGTDGVRLLPVVEDAGRLLVLDAVRTGAEPGALVTLHAEDLPHALPLAVSPHQIDLRQVFALAVLRGTLPRELVVLGLEPEQVEFGAGLGDLVARRIDGLVEHAAARLAAWGHGRCERREAVRRDA
jgi:hydrogenase maturation protease